MVQQGELVHKVETVVIQVLGVQAHLQAVVAELEVLDKMLEDQELELLILVLIMQEEELVTQQ
jgi:hypothetical protein